MRKGKEKEKLVLYKKTMFTDKFKPNTFISLFSDHNKFTTNLIIDLTPFSHANMKNGRFC